jgi:alpha-L-arabinofuranosidase
VSHHFATGVIAALAIASAGHYSVGIGAGFVPQAPPPSAAPLGTGRIAIDASKTGAAIPPRLYGIFYEEINHAGDGGLYAELVRNRGFEDANLPPACVREGNFIVPPRTPHFDTGKPSEWRLRWDETDPHPAWSLNIPSGSAATIGLTVERPLNDATPHSLQVDVTATAPGRAPQLVNAGHWGMNVVRGDRYRLSFFSRSEAPVRATAILQSADGRTLAEHPVSLAAGNWRRQEVVLTASAADAQGRLALRFETPGRVWLDMVSLFPARTFKDRPNGMRPDLAQVIADMKPGFIRGPGGCFAEGITIESRPQWKRSLGPIEERTGTYSPWGYWSTDGFGYHEFLQFAEDINADALWVINVGVSCSMRSGTYLPDSELPALIQDALDAIEYAIGPTTSKWGALRAKLGHPKPFPLKYIEIGNEQRGARYGERVAQFYKAIKARYPQMKVALSSWIAGIDRNAIDAVGPIDIIDEHAYKPVNWAIENFGSFDGYKREGWDLYIGEFATNAGVGRGNWIAAINDAAYMMNVEKNTDLVKMASYAPLLENINHRDWEVNMIHFDSSRVFARASYYVQKLFAEHLPSVALPAAVTFTPAGEKAIAGPVGVGTWNTAAEFRDIRIERDGKTIYQSDFEKAPLTWLPVTGRGQGSRGTWSVADGAYRQSADAIGFSYLTGSDSANATISLKARKISGAEGFLVMGGQVDGRRVQWNVAGWGNTQSAIQASDAIVGRAVRHRIETGRWYDLRLEVRGRTVRGYIDGVLLNEATYPRIDTVLAIAGRDDRTGEIIVKALNTGPEAAAVTFEISGAARIAATGQLTTLSSASPLEENSFETPRKIVPVTSTVTGLSKSFARTLPPYSLSILRVGTRQ